MRKVKTWKEFNVGDQVTKIIPTPNGRSDNGLIDGEEYTIMHFHISTNEKNVVFSVDGQGKNDWGVYADTVMLAVTGRCRTCLESCKQDNKGTCAFYRTTFKGS